MTPIEPAGAGAQTLPFGCSESGLQTGEPTERTAVAVGSVVAEAARPRDLPAPALVATVTTEATITGLASRDPEVLIEEGDDASLARRVRRARGRDSASCQTRS